MLFLILSLYHSLTIISQLERFKPFWDPLDPEAASVVLAKQFAGLLGLGPAGLVVGGGRRGALGDAVRREQLADRAAAGRLDPGEGPRLGAGVRDREVLPAEVPILAAGAV